MSGTEPDEGFVTVAEAAQAMGIDPRQVRRYADRLSETDRTPNGQRPLRVRLSVLLSYRSSNTESAKLDKKDQKDFGQDTFRAASKCRKYLSGTSEKMPASEDQPIPSEIDSSSALERRIAAAYEIALAERQARIDLLEGQLADARERELTANNREKALLDALTRAQGIKLLEDSSESKKAANPTTTDNFWIRLRNWVRTRKP